MSKGRSGLFIHTKGDKHFHSVSSHAVEQEMHRLVKKWAREKKKELTGKAKKSFNTSCIVYDESTGKYYYGRNGGYNENGYFRNPILFGDNSHEGLLPKQSLNKYPVGNCAEVDAVNRAMNDGASIANLRMITIHTTKGSFGKYKESCENCRYAFLGKIIINYSGWKENTND